MLGPNRCQFERTELRDDVPPKAPLGYFSRRLVERLLFHPTLRVLCEGDPSGDRIGKGATKSSRLNVGEVVFGRFLLAIRKGFRPFPTVGTLVAHTIPQPFPVQRRP